MEYDISFEFKNCALVKYSLGIFVCVCVVCVSGVGRGMLHSLWDLGSLNLGLSTESRESYPLGHQRIPSLYSFWEEFTMSGRGVLSNAVAAYIEMIM